jgi:hypothetical protein
MRFFAAILLLIPNLLSAQNTITYHQHIAPILQKNCVPCHQKEEVGAMPLTNYEEVSSYGKMIGYVTKTGLMPPFLADEPRHELEGAKQLSDSEIQLIQDWVAQGVLEGEKPKIPLPLPPKIAQLENPDAVISMSEAFEQYGIYYDQYRVFTLSTDFGEDKMISAIEFVPGNKKIVRQAMISIDTSQRVSAWDEWDPQYGYFSFGELGFVPLENRWYSWNPTQSFTQFPNGTAKFLPKGAKLLLHLHYGPTGVPAQDSSFVKLKFAEKPIEKIIQNAPLIGLHNLTNDTFLIPENETVRFHAKFTVPFDLELWSLMPHAHYLARKWEVFAVEPETRKAETLIKITDWDFHWKQNFVYKKPKIIKKGTVIHALAEYDNSANNLANPSEPPRTMAWGKRMYEELFLVYFGFVPHFEKEKNKPFFEILPTATNVSRPDFSLSFSTQKKGEFSLSIFNFKGEEVLSIFKNQTFKKGKHDIQLNFSQLEKGNYYFELKSAEKAVTRIFVNLAATVFD